jgi:hypothetical protein
MCTTGQGCGKYTEKDYKIWSKRHEILQHHVADRSVRKELFKVWHEYSSVPFTEPVDTSDWKGVAVRDFQIEIGRALLDFPDIDRDAVLKRVRMMESMRKKAA